MRRSGAGLVCGLLLASGAVAGCGGKDSNTDSDKDADGGALAGAADRTICTAAAKPVATPYDKAFPDAWTFPPMSVVYSVEDRDQVGVIVTAVTSDPFMDVLAYLNKDITAAGFAFNDGETEDDDAEANWTFTGYTGRWTIRKSDTCDGETVIQVLASPAT